MVSFAVAGRCQRTCACGYDTKRSLRSQIEKYHALGYRCFFPLRWAKWTKKFRHRVATLSRSVVEISPPCYHASYDRRAIGWKNVVCIDAQDPDLVAMMANYSKTPREPRVCHVGDGLKKRFPRGIWRFDNRVRDSWV
eukprot:PhM_4_TR2100/c2_g1_i4/m.6497